MSFTMNFRSALNGFNREDVANYISYMNNKHNSEVTALATENERLQSRAARVDELTEAQNRAQQLLQEQAVRNEELLTQLQQLREENRKLQDQMAELSAREQTQKNAPDNDMELARMRSRCNALEEQLLRAQANDRGASLNRNAEQELEAYRRAERTERVARERAEQIYRQASTAIDGAANKVDTAFTMISELSDQVSNQLAQLHSAISGSKHALADAASTLYTIRPEDETR